MVQVASFLDPRTVLALTHTCPMAAYFLCVFTSEYTIEQDISGYSYTPLQYYVSRGIERVLIHLLEHGTDPNYVDFARCKRQTTPLILAVRLRSASMVSLLLQYRARVNDLGCAGNHSNAYTALHGVGAGTPPLSMVVLASERGQLRDHQRECRLYSYCSTRELMSKQQFVATVHLFLSRVVYRLITRSEFRRLFGSAIDSGR